ncbi:hypothetical protein [Terasakiella pusilla]|uniref:hypothetical protein n=1 Tax=Terasakiella pusilla TaxID=64973 RepID=UPI003AA96A0C
MRVLWFVAALLTVTSAEAADDRPLTAEERVFHQECLDRVKMLAEHRLDDLDKYGQAIVVSQARFLQEKQDKNLSGYLPKFRGKACHKMWDGQVAEFARRKARQQSETDQHDFEVKQRQEEMKWLEDTRAKLLAMSSSHEIRTGNGYRIDYYTINGRQEHCTTQVYSQGPIMKCSRWPD